MLGGVMGPALQRAHVWLCLNPCPPGVVQDSVWQVVCLAAVSAMEYGRRLLWALHYEAQHARAAGPRLRQPTLFEVWGIDPPVEPVVRPGRDPPSVSVRAQQGAQGFFWGRLQEFVRLQAGSGGRGRRSWPPGRRVLRASHPFLAHVPVMGSGRQRLVLTGLPDLPVGEPQA